MLLEVGPDRQRRTRCSRSRRGWCATLATSALSWRRWHRRQRMWNEAARRWRETMTQTPQLYQAAVFALAQATGVARDSVRTESAGGSDLAAGPTCAGVARADLDAAAAGVAGVLRIEAWMRSVVRHGRSLLKKRMRGVCRSRRARRGPPSIARTVDARARCARRMRRSLAVKRQRPWRWRRRRRATFTPQLGLRDAVPVRLRAMAALGRAADALALVDSVRPKVVPLQLQMLERELMWAWLRVGDAARARPFVARLEDDEATALLAIYDGDLEKARAALRNADASNTLLLAAPRAAVAHDAAHSPALGAAFTALAQE